MKYKNLLYNFLLILFSSLIALILVEIFLRFNNQGPWGTLDKQRNDPTINKPHNKLGWVPKKGVYEFEPFSDEGEGFTVNILEDGSRKVAYQNRKLSKNELIFLGGSITLGWGINDDQTFVSKLQEYIKNYKIKNFAAGGYGTYQLFLRLEELLSKNNNIKTVVLIYVPNHAGRNIGDEFWLRTLTKFSKRGYVGLPYASINDQNDLIRHNPIKYIKTPFMDSIAISNKIAKRIMRAKLKDNEKNKYRVTDVIFSEIKKVSRKNNVNLIIVNISADKNAFAPYLNTFKKEKINYFNCIIKRTKELTIKGDGHPNDLMHTQFSRCMYENLNNFIKLS
jgi:hypothetical protein